MEKDLLNNFQQHPEEKQLSLFVEMILNESLLQFRKEKLRKEIDKSLKDRNKEAFFRLTEELKNIS